jgi:TonB-linked SusC/RagA family outer membrane protein
MGHDSSFGTLVQAASPPRSGTRGPLRPRWVPAALLAALILAPTGSARAQGGTVSGTVVAAGTLTPLEGAQVTVAGTELRAMTDASGRFRLINVPGTEATLEVRRIRFQPLTRSVRVGDTDVRLQLTEVTVRLDEIVVTGTAGGEQRRAVGNAVAQISAPEELERSGVSDVGNLINARAPGVIITSGSGRVGAGPSVWVRGISTISLNQQPLLYIDGVRVANDAGTGVGRQGGLTISRLNDISPEDIESIEIIKGPAAATIYGTEASNGVIQIITKKGRVGDAQWNASIRGGSQWFMDAEDRIPTNYAKNAAGEILSWNAVASEKARGNDIWKPGYMQSYSGSVSGGVAATRYMLSSTYDKDRGIEPHNGLRRFTGHANLSIVPSDKIEVSSSLNVVKSNIQLGAESGLGAFWGALFGSPLAANGPTRGFSIAPPEAVWDLYDDTQDVTRFTGSVQFNHSPAAWFSQRLTVGIDETTEDNQSLTLYAPPQYRALFTATDARGYIFQDLREISHSTADYSASFKASLTGSLNSTTSLGGQFFRKRVNTTEVDGREFPAPGVRTAAAAAIRVGSQDYLTNTTVGAYAQQQFGWNDRLFVTGAIRVDNNSAFGEDFKWVTYPKVSASWVISEEPFWTPTFVSSLKLRAAYGQAGQQPDVFTALRTFQPVTGTGDQPAVTPQAVGNPDLKPERGTELELGFEAGFFDRLSVDFTWFDKDVRDQILLRPIPPSLGFPGSQYTNIGRVSNKGVEVLATLQALNRENFGLELTANVATAKNRIEDLGGIPFIAVGGLPQRHVEGYSIASYFTKRVVSANLNDQGVAVDLMCDGGPENDGQPMPCAQAPVVHMGDIAPKVNGAFSGTITLWKQLRLYGLVDFKRGHSLLNADEFARCMVFRLCDANVNPQNHPTTYVANVQNGSSLVIADALIQDASYAKLREVSVSYTLPTSWTQRARLGRASITLAGRNLHTWTDYRGLDPESRAQIAGLSTFDQAMTPSLAQFIGTLNLTF